MHLEHLTIRSDNRVLLDKQVDKPWIMCKWFVCGGRRVLATYRAWLCQQVVRPCHEGTGVRVC
jgi:hypothetical protein